MDLRSELRPEHFEELQEIKRGQLFEQVPLWLWSPVISGQERDQVAAAAEALAERLVEIGLRERERGNEHAWLPSLPGLLESVRMDPVDTDPTFHWRFDFLWDRPARRIRFLELNAGDPSGLGWIARFTEAMREHSLWSSKIGTKLSSFDLAGSHRRAMENVVGGRPERVAFVRANDSTVSSDIACWAETFRVADYAAEVVDPLQLEFHEEGLCRDSRRINVLLRDTYEELFWPPYEGVGKRLQTLVRAGRLTLLNPLCSTFWDSKALWTELREWPEAAPTFRLAEAVPEREQWVLKPVFDYGGRGVICGSACSAQQWQAAVQVARGELENWVLQEKIPFCVEPFPFLTPDRQIVWEDRYLTWSVYLDRGKFAGIIARAGSNPVVNVHNGGAIFPVYLENDG